MAVAGGRPGRVTLTGDRRDGVAGARQPGSGGREWPPLCRARPESRRQDKCRRPSSARAADEPAAHYGRLSAASGAAGGHTARGARRRRRRPGARQRSARLGAPAQSVAGQPPPRQQAGVVAQRRDRGGGRAGAVCS